MNISELTKKAFLRAYADELVNMAYRGILTREADLTGLAAYTKALKGSADLAGLLKELSFSDEHWQKTLDTRAPDLVRALFQGLLGREPDAEARESYVAKLAESHDLTPLLAEIARSDEHWQKTLDARAPGLVRALYQGLLGREPKPETLDGYAARLAETHDLTPLLTEIARSDEFRQKTFTALAPDLVRAAYRGLLGREPNPEGLAAQATTLVATKDLAALLTNIVCSDEFSRLRANLQSCHNPAATYDSPTIISPLGRETIHATFFRDLFTAATAPEAGVSKDDLLARARHRTEAIAKSQEDYQPFYGLPGKKHQSVRRDNLLLSVELVRDHFAQISMKTKVRVLDVGCNAGFVSFSLAETFPLTRGIDISPEHIALCKDLAAYTGSPARFAECDILKVMETADADFENVDCVLLLNVVHQFIFAKGIPYVRKFLAWLADRVDVIFVELARKEEYKRFNKDPLLPEDPATVLSSIRNCNIHLVKSAGRPLYKITRQNAVFGRLSVPLVRFRYTECPTFHENRKYYMGNGRFLKVFRFTQITKPAVYYREVRALLALTGTISVPQILDWTITPTYGAIMMEEAPGDRLFDLLPQSFKQFSSHHGIIAFMREYLGVAALLAEKKLYHNDMSAHNIVVLPTGGMRFVDFEQADTFAYQDPFAVMLWAIYDVLSEDIASYKPSVYKQLYVKSGGERVSPEHYPDFSKFDLPPIILDLLSSAKTHNSWFTFAAEWSDRLAALQKLAAPLVDKSGSQRTGSCQPHNMIFDVPTVPGAGNGASIRTTLSIDLVDADRSDQHQLDPLTEKEN